MYSWESITHSSSSFITRSKMRKNYTSYWSTAREELFTTSWWKRKNLLKTCKPLRPALIQISQDHSLQEKLPHGFSSLPSPLSFWFPFDVPHSIWKVAAERWSIFSLPVELEPVFFLTATLRYRNPELDFIQLRSFLGLSVCTTTI